MTSRESGIILPALQMLISVLSTKPGHGTERVTNLDFAKTCAISINCEIITFQRRRSQKASLSLWSWTCTCSFQREERGSGVEYAPTVSPTYKWLGSMWHIISRYEFFTLDIQKKTCLRTVRFSCAGKRVGCQQDV